MVAATKSGLRHQDWSHASPACPLGNLCSVSFSPSPLCRRQRVFQVAIKLAARIDMTQLRQFLRGALLDIPQIGIQLLDIVLGERPLELL